MSVEFILSRPTRRAPCNSVHPVSARYTPLLITEESVIMIAIYNNPPDSEFFSYAVSSLSNNRPDSSCVSASSDTKVSKIERKLHPSIHSFTQSERFREQSFKLSQSMNEDAFVTRISVSIKLIYYTVYTQYRFAKLDFIINLRLVRN